jgi:hypothetical protein
MRRDAVLHLREEAGRAIASAPDGAVFLTTWEGSVYRRMPGASEWTRVATVPRPDEASPLEGEPNLRVIHPFSARGFIVLDYERLYRWREGEPMREEKTVFSDSSTHCGDFHSRLRLWAAWGTENDTYVVGGHGNVLHYRDGQWRLERTPLSDVQPDLCMESYGTDLVAAGGADGWVYAAGRRIIRSRGDGRWEEVPGPGLDDTTAAVGAITNDGSEMLFATHQWRGHEWAEPEGKQTTRFYRPGPRPGTWTEAARLRTNPPIVNTGAQRPGGPAVFYVGDGGRVLVVEGGRVRIWWLGSSGRINGATPAGRDVLLAVNDSSGGYVSVSGGESGRRRSACPQHPAALCFCIRSSRRTCLHSMRIPVVLALAVVIAACGREPAWTRLEVDELRSDPLLRLPDETIYTIASAPDGAVFVSTFDGNVYRRMPRGREWTRVATLTRAYEQAALLAIYPFSARGFVATEFSRIYRWREGQPLREEKTVLSDSARACGDFTSYVTLSDAWGTENDTYVVGGHGNVLHYRGGRWRLERTPLTDVQPDLCYESYGTDLVAAGGADGWVYAAGRRIIRSRGDGRWEEVPGPGRGDTTAAVGAITNEGSEMLFATHQWRGHDWAEPEGKRTTRFYHPGPRPGTWTEAARLPTNNPGVDEGTQRPGGPAVFFGNGGHIVLVDGGRVRAWFPGSGRVRGAVPVGRDVLVAVNDSATGLVVRLPR